MINSELFPRLLYHYRKVVPITIAGWQTIQLIMQASKATVSPMSSSSSTTCFSPTCQSTPSTAMPSPEGSPPPYPFSDSTTMRMTPLSSDALTACPPIPRPTTAATSTQTCPNSTMDSWIDLIFDQHLAPDAFTNTNQTFYRCLLPELQADSYIVHKVISAGPNPGDGHRRVDVFQQLFHVLICKGYRLRCSPYLNEYGDGIGWKNYKIAASQAIKQYGSSLAHHYEGLHGIDSCGWIQAADVTSLVSRDLHNP